MVRPRAGRAAGVLLETRSPTAGTTRAKQAAGSLDLGSRTGEIKVQLGARLVADAGWVGALDQAPPSVSEDVVVVRAQRPVQPEPDAMPVRIDARIGLGDHFHFEGRGLDARLTGQVHVVGTIEEGLRAEGVKIFDEPVYNYTREFPYIWEELTLPVTYGSDRARAERILLDAAERHGVSTTELTREALEELQRRYAMKRGQINPKVYYSLTDNWLELTVRFVVQDHGIRTAAA